jgi:hypothetical protein
MTWLRRAQAATQVWAARHRPAGIAATPVIFAGYALRPLAAVRVLSDDRARKRTPWDA